MSETLEQFTKRMSKVEKTDELVVGRAHQGNSRALFEFEGQHCTLESFGYFTPSADERRNIPPVAFCLRALYNPPYDYWTHSRLFYTKKRAEMLAKHYGAKGIEEDYYPREEGLWFFLMFKEFEDLMRMVYDIHTGKFKEMFGDEAKEYQSCIGYLEEKA